MTVPMTCPDDGSDLREEAPGVHACRRCNGRAMQRTAFEASHGDVENILEPEDDVHSGAFARERGCPECRRTMAPLRLGDQLCWLDWCAPCGVLWVEKLDTYVIDRLEKRIARTRAVLEIPAEERRRMSAEIARDVGDLERNAPRARADDQAERLVQVVVHGVLRRRRRVALSCSALDPVSRIRRMGRYGGPMHRESQAGKARSRRPRRAFTESRRAAGAPHPP